MRSFLFLILMAVLVAGCASTDTSAIKRPSVDDWPSYEEVHNRASSLPSVAVTLGELGTQRAKTHERIISDRWISYLCLDRVLQTPRGNINAALCAPDWYKRIYSATTIIRYVYQAGITQHMPLRRALYKVVDNLRHDQHIGRVGTIMGVYR